MSAHGHATPGDAAESHEQHHYEGIPADRAGPDEPRTPLWLPLVGISLLLLTLLAYVMTRPAGKSGAELAQEASPEPSAVAPAAAPGDSARRVRRLPPSLASALGAAPGGAAPGAAAPGVTVRAAGTAGAAPPPGAAPGAPFGKGVPRPTPAAPGAAPTPNPPHGAPGHVH